jgi:hypothetical protein
VWGPFCWRPPFYLREALFNLKAGDTLSGVHWSTRGPWFTLRNASVLKPGQPPLAIDGDVVIHRDRIDFVQVLP